MSHLFVAKEVSRRCVELSAAEGTGAREGGVSGVTLRLAISLSSPRLRSPVSAKLNLPMY